MIVAAHVILWLWWVLAVIGTSTSLAAASVLKDKQSILIQVFFSIVFIIAVFWALLVI